MMGEELPMACEECAFRAACETYRDDLVREIGWVGVGCRYAEAA